MNKFDIINHRNNIDTKFTGKMFEARPNFAWLQVTEWIYISFVFISDS